VPVLHLVSCTLPSLPTHSPLALLGSREIDKLIELCSASLHFTDTLDVLLTRDLTRFHIIDFNPYAPRTDSLLFTYEELATLFDAAAAGTTPAPTLRVIDSPAHPAATRNAPQYQHNMVPLEALTLSEGRNMEEFASAWMEQVTRGAVESDEDGEG
jgi:hypothetical protein